MAEAQVVIVGSGVSGLALAIALGQDGVPVRLVERRSDPGALLRSRPSVNLTLGVRGTKVLDDLGLGASVIEASTRVHARRIHAPSGGSSLHPYGVDGESVLSIRRTRLMGILLDRACSLPSVSMSFGESVELLDTGGRVAARAADGTSHTLRADLVVGADGLNSPVRAAVHAAQGLPDSNPRPTGIRWVELPARDGWDGADEPTIDIWPRHPYMLIAFPNRHEAKSVQLFAPEGHPMPDAAAFARLAPELGLSTEEYEGALWEEDEVRVVDCDAWYHDRAVVIGDAAHAITPFLGQGANAALEDAAVLAHLIRAGEPGKVGPELHAIRSPETRCLGRLARAHYDDLRAGMADGRNHLGWDLRVLLAKHFPGHFQPLYNRVAFGDDPLVAAEAAFIKEAPHIAAIVTALYDEFGTSAQGRP